MKFKKTLATLLVGGTLMFGGNKARATPFIENQITSNSYSQEKPAISDGKIVWQDNRNGNWDIYSWDSESGESPLITNSSSQENPSISQGNVVWQDNRSGKNNIYLWNQANGETQVSGGVYNNVNPDISGLNIAWKEVTGSQDHIFVGNPAQGYSEPEGGFGLGSPQISGNRAVWSKYRGPDSYIHEGGFNIGEETVTSSMSRLENPDIFEDLMVWENGHQIYLRDPSGESGFISSTNTGYNPQIWGDTVVWEDNRNGNWDIYGWDRLNGEMQITSNIYDQRLPSIHGEDIVWQDNRNGNWDIYSTTIPEPATIGLLGMGAAALALKRKK